MLPQSCIIKYLGLQPYETTWQAMKDFTHARNSHTADELWVVEHPAVYTLGQAGNIEHLLKKTTIPVVRTDRGGQITYHGPGQVVIYTLINVKRKNLGVRALVSLLENSVIDLLKHYNIIAHADPQAPGVYIKDAKICAIGLRIHKGCAFHGLALNVAMDLSPFKAINPCGYPHLKVTQLSKFIHNIDPKEVMTQLIACLLLHLGYNTVD